LPLTFPRTRGNEGHLKGQEGKMTAPLIDARNALSQGLRDAEFYRLALWSNM
jgi:hypothetical protein